MPPDLLEVFVDELARRAGSFEPRDIAISAWALATLSPQPDRFETRFVVGGDDGVETAVVIGKVTRGDGSSRVHPSLEPVEAAAVARISEFNPQDFSNLIWAFAKLNHTPGPEFQVEFEEAALENMRSFNTQNLSNTAYAYAALNLPVGTDFNTFRKLKGTKKLFF